MKKILPLILLGLLAQQAQAIQITYTYEGLWDSYNSGDFGESYIASITFDNGGTDIANQTFDQSDFLSASLTSGSFDNTWEIADVTGWFTDFTSDATGRLGLGWVDLANSGGFMHFDNDYADEFAENASGGAGYFSSHVSGVGVAASVPEPGALALLGFGLAGLSLVRRKKS